MGTMFRSEEMALCQMFIQPEAAFTSIAKLGEAGIAQFRDLNPNLNAYNRKFVQEVRRCGEMVRRLKYIKGEVEKAGIVLPELVDFLPGPLNPRDLVDVEIKLEQIENEIFELAENEISLKYDFLEVIELNEVLQNTKDFFSDDEVIDLDAMKPYMNQENIPNGHGSDQLAFVAGVVARDRLVAFETMLWRVSRGNVFIRRVDLEETMDNPRTGEPVLKTVFVAFFQGEQLKSRIKKVCTGFHASLYPCPSSQKEREEMVRNVRIRLEDLKLILNQTEDQRKLVLFSVAKEISTWCIMVKKMKAIYHTLNLFNTDVTKKCLIGECWVPKSDVRAVTQILSEGASIVQSYIPSFVNVIETNDAPPTFNRTNRFTRGFQNLIDAYGLASYGEVNPALYTIITFPFLFGVMFGDVGHGIILTVFGGWMILSEQKFLAKKTANEIWNIFFGGRYIIFLMGLFSIYTGAIYNDIFSRSMNIFGSGWRVTHNFSIIEGHKELILDPKHLHNTYIFGMDPVWQLAGNKIIFQNSFKMKLSIIFGVVHMLFGVCLSVVNHVHFKKKIYIVLEFLPQMIFLLLLFAYMVFMMIYKWAAYSAENAEIVDQPRCAPSILILFINMVLFKHTPPFPGCDEYMFEGQDILQMVFIVISLMCIPWLLLGKPLYIQYKRKKHLKLNGDAMNGEGGIENVAPTTEDGEETPISEVVIDQTIHTIEFILSTISHTASYLRLWALSLAHAQLSEVLWERVLSLVGLRLINHYIAAVFIFVLFIPWAFFTVAILVMMEGLSAFLHTLRLHWVEFLTKFYSGEGYAFQPFCFKTILQEDDEKEFT